MKIALCQLNTITGNVAFNTRRIVEELGVVSHAGARLAIFQEMAITGYPPKDLLEYSSFVEEATEALQTIRRACHDLGIDCIVGTIHENIFEGKKALLNAAAIVPVEGEVRYAYKKLLPTYDVFDEHRYFQACPAKTDPVLVDYDDNGRKLRIGLSICEDIWNDNEFWQDDRRYEFDPIEMIVNAGADLIVNVSASPYVLGKPQRRVEMLRHSAARWQKPVLIVNQVGGCDQIIFDGGSGVVMPSGAVPCFAGWFSESTVIWNTEDVENSPTFDKTLEEVSDDVFAMHGALILGLRDYLRKTHFEQVVVGNSGGIDSAVVLTLAVDALGAGNVISVSMPGPFTSAETRADSTEIARRLGVRHLELPIVDVFHEYRSMLGGPDSVVVGTLFDGRPEAVSRLANENVQARIRGNVLMWISNAINTPRTLVISTGNKSEVAAGYCTLYGDMAGGLAVISDVPKMMVYKLARFLNARMGDVIPQSIIDREPTAELAPNQKDSDSLPPYPVLDEIIRMYVEERKGLKEIVESGVAPEELVKRVVRLIGNAEYKRAQAAPGLKVTSKAFGFGRRMPIARG